MNNTNNQTQNNKNNKLNITIKVLIIVLIILVLFSLGILLVRLGDFLPNNTDIFFIEPKEGDVEFSDDKEIWDLNTQIDIFSITDKNEDGKVTVESIDGNKVIAPGTEGTYRFQIKNKGNIAVDTETKLSVDFIADGFEYDTLPIEVKFTNYKGEILSDEAWISIDKFEECIDELTIGRNSYVYYQFDWRWKFESGDDELDTYLGNLSCDSVVKMTVGIQATATQSENYDAEGGLKSGDGVPRVGGSLVPVPYIVLNLIILIILAILITLEISKRKQQSEQIKNVVEETTDQVL